VVPGSAGGALFAADGKSTRAHHTSSRVGALSNTFAPLLIICAACSPASYAVEARSAERALAAAEVTPAASDKAPYELWLARLYLAKAREESSQAHYAVARELLVSARHNAVLARQLSLSRPANQQASR
jgi:hypothetical protein